MRQYSWMRWFDWLICAWRGFHRFSPDEISGYHFYCPDCGKWESQIIRHTAAFLEIDRTFFGRHEFTADDIAFMRKCQKFRKDDK